MALKLRTKPDEEWLRLAVEQDTFQCEYGLDGKADEHCQTCTQSTKGRSGRMNRAHWQRMEGTMPMFLCDYHHDALVNPVVFSPVSADEFGRGVL